MRVGVGYDSHRFDPGRLLTLGGVRIPDHPGLAGHSDADAVVHAVIDALLGAAALGDIGAHFPDDDPRFADADSLSLLATTIEVLRGHGLRVGNVDATVITERPRIGNHVEAMRTKLSEILEIPADAVSIKAKSNEGMGWIGRGEGLAVIAVASVEGIGSRPVASTPGS